MTLNLLVSLLVSSVGLGYFIYGRRQSHLGALLSGLGMMLVPLFIGTWWGNLLLGLFLGLLPRWWR